eukprot:COSAG02_NODE_1655_length_11483_cov_3.754327_5_plen_38_part_00
MSEPYDWARELYGAPNFTFRESPVGEFAITSGLNGHF